MAGNYRDLQAWRSAMDLVLDIYRCTRTFPRDETYDLTSQMRRAAVSIPSNIAEGKGRYSQKELIQFLFRARGSLLELETQILIARQLEYLDETRSRQLTAKSQELGRILNVADQQVRRVCPCPRGSLVLRKPET
jgi:four helix bundle protein